MIVLPKKIYLSAVGKHWKVCYRQKPGKLTLLELPYRQLIVYGKNYSKRQVIELLNRWVKRQADNYLSALVFKLNKKIKMHYAKLTIHSLKTEWGSYSSKQKLGLNYKLIFLPPQLVKYIIIHELCHAKYLDHSPEFWKFLAKFDKNWQKNRMAVDDADVHIPAWLIFQITSFPLLKSMVKNDP